MLCDIRHSIVEMRRQGGDPVHVIVCAGEYGRTTRGADRVRDVAVIKADAFVRYAVEVRRRIDSAAIAPHGLACVIISHDEQDVWSRGHNVFVSSPMV